jgi:cap1 methyltransferase
VFRLDGGRWLKIDHLELSPDTLLYGEIVMELRGEGRSQCKFTTLHIIDAIFLGGIDISGEHLTLRYIHWWLMASIFVSMSRELLIKS